MNEKTEESPASPDTESMGKRIDPILEHLEVEGAQGTHSQTFHRYLGV
jgi:hypothetical protein